MSTDFFCSPKRYAWQWGSHNLLFRGYRLRREVQRSTRNTADGRNECRYTSASPIRLHGVDNGTFAFLTWDNRTYIILCAASRCEVNPVAMVPKLRTILCLLKHSTHCLLECAASQRVRQRVLIQQQPNTPSSSRNTALCRKDENLIKPLPCMALLHYSIPRLSLGSLAPLWVLSLTQQSDNDVTKSQTSNASIRFIRAAFEFFFWSRDFTNGTGMLQGVGETLFDMLE